MLFKQFFANTLTLLCVAFFKLTNVFFHLFSPLPLTDNPLINKLTAKNVKSVVWPPPNPPEDELPKSDLISETISEIPKDIVPAKIASRMVAEFNSKCAPQQTSDVQPKMMQQSVSSMEQRQECSSSVSYASASISTATATSSKSESIMQSKQSQAVQEIRSCTVQSFSEQSSVESQSTKMYQSQTSPPVQTSYDNPMDEIKTVQIKENIKQEADLHVIQRSQDFKADHVKAVETPETTDKTKENTTKENVCTKTEERRESIIDDVKESLSGKSEIHSKAESILDTVEQHTVSVTQTEIINTKLDQQINLPHAESTELKVAQSDAKSKSITDQVALNHEDERKPLSEQENEIPQNVGALKQVFESSKTLIEIDRSDIPPIKPLPPTSIPNSIPRGFVRSMVDALTTAPDRPFSPLPTPPQPISLPPQTIAAAEAKVTKTPVLPVSSQSIQLPPQPSPIFAQQPNRGITPIPPIKAYNPPEKLVPPIPMPEETKPYIPPDFKITIEPKVPRDEAASPLVEALRTVPDRPFTPVSTAFIERGSLKEALTIAPDRPYSPLPLNITNESSQSSHYTATSTVQMQTASSEIVRPIATQTSTQMTDVVSEFSAMQNTCKLQSSSEVSAFRPVARQVFPPPQPEEFSMLANLPPISDDMKTSFEKFRSQHETMVSETKTMQQSTVTTSSSTQGYSSVKMAQSYFEQLDQKESLSSTSVRSKSGLNKPDKIPPYQKNFDKLPSQRGITPEICNAPAIPQRPVTPSTDAPKPRGKSQEPKCEPGYTMSQEKQTSKIPQIKTAVQQPAVQFHKDSTPITMTFQPVTDENILRMSPARSRPTTPSLINKPAPIIPYYQMNLVSVEHTAPETNLYDVSSREASRSPTPKPRSRSPAQGPPPNPLKAQAPRIKEATPQRQVAHSLLTKATENLRKEHEMGQKVFQTDSDACGIKNWSHNQFPMIQEQRHSNVGFKSETHNKGDMRLQEDSMINQNYGQRQMQSQSMSEYGNTVVQTTRKTFEEFESTQSAKVIEIRKGGSLSSTAFHQNESNNIQTHANAKQVFPPPIMSMPTSQQSSFNVANDNIASASRLVDSPSISGANQVPVCDPTPSTGSGVGAAGRGKTFGVSSAPKRGRGILNKAALPGSRVPLCASCNGNIR